VILGKLKNAMVQNDSYGTVEYYLRDCLWSGKR